MPRRPLSQESILEAAVAVADDGGLHAVSMRSVGRQLGVEAMSLYHHVASKSALLDALADRVIGRVALPTIDAAWRPAMEDLAASTRAVYTQHPWAISLIESRATPGPAILRHHDRVLGCLVTSGFSIALASHAFSAIDAYVFGFVITELQLPFSAGEGEAFSTQLDLPADEYPHLVALMRELVIGRAYDYGDEFEYGLALLLDQIEVRHAAEAAPTRSGGVPEDPA